MFKTGSFVDERASVSGACASSDTPTSGKLASGKLASGTLASGTLASEASASTISTAVPAAFAASPAPQDSAEGASLVEYCLLLAIIALTVMLAMPFLTQGISSAVVKGGSAVLIRN